MRADQQLAGGIMELGVFGAIVLASASIITAMPLLLWIAGGLGGIGVVFCASSSTTQSSGNITPRASPSPVVSPPALRRAKSKAWFTMMTWAVRIRARACW